MTHLQKILANAASRAAALGLAGTLALLSGCATIVGDEHASLPIKSTPADAQILIVDEAGNTAYRGRTPDRVPLRKSDGRYWGGKQFTVTISKRGYLTQRVKVDTRPNALYLGGNLIFGGIIGWLVVDPTSGKMYDLASEGIEVALQPRPDEDPSAAADPEPAMTATPLTEPVPATRPVPPITPPAATTHPAEPRPIAPVTTGARVAPAPARESTSESSAPSIFVPERPPGGGKWTPVDTAPAGAAAAQDRAGEPAATPAPAAPPAEPRPYWPAPPALPVSPSSAAPHSSSIA